MNWFSAKVRLVCLIEPRGAEHYMDSVYIFRATGFEAALERAISLGSKQEEEYVNHEEKRVRWRLKEVVSLDIIQGDNLDGVEVYSEPAELGEREFFPFESDFEPEKSKPTQTI